MRSAYSINRLRNTQQHYNNHPNCGKICSRGGGEMADAGDLKSPVLTDVWVRIPPAL